eukprot:GHVN01043840.1.p1 GENE.GHVN01043840.1~~GHVN01043840.1.p1  ORF type:complete len:202 (+),score=43.09 GHVN01043840.1:128-733(+)
MQQYAARKQREREDKKLNDTPLALRPTRPKGPWPPKGFENETPMSYGHESIEDVSGTDNDGVVFTKTLLKEMKSGKTDAAAIEFNEFHGKPDDKVEYGFRGRVEGWRMWAGESQAKLTGVEHKRVIVDPEVYDRKEQSTNNMCDASKVELERCLTIHQSVRFRCLVEETLTKERCLHSTQDKADRARSASTSLNSPGQEVK